MYMHVWGHLRFGALLRYAGIALLFVIVGAGLYFQFGPQAISYVSGFGKNSDAPLLVSDLPAQQATVITTGEDWKRTLNMLTASYEQSTSSSTAYQPTMVDELMGLYLKKKIQAGKTGSVNPEAVVQEYLSGRDYHTSTLHFENSAFHVSSAADVSIYSTKFKNIIKEYNERTASIAVPTLATFKNDLDLDKLKPLGTMKPIIEHALEELLALEVPPASLALHKESAEYLLNQAFLVGQIDNANGDLIQTMSALAQYFDALQNGPTLYSRIMAIK